MTSVLQKSIVGLQREKKFLSIDFSHKKKEQEELRVEFCCILYVIF
jgi:hypothetical protein